MLAPSARFTVTQFLELMHEAKGPGAADFFHERRAGEIDTGMFRVLSVHRMVVKQRVCHLEPVEGLELYHFVTLTYPDFLGNTDVLLGRILFLDTGGLDEENEGAGTAIHDGNFGCTDVHETVVDAEPGHGRHQVFHGGDTDGTFHQGRGQGGFADVFCQRRYAHDRIEIHSAEDDAGVDGRRAQRQEHLFTGV